MAVPFGDHFQARRIRQHAPHALRAVDDRERAEIADVEITAVPRERGRNDVLRE
jgi:hypothetical protein